MNAPTSPIAVTPLELLGAFAVLLADLIAEEEQAGESTGILRATAKFTAMIIGTRGVEDAARFAALVNNLALVDDPRAVTP